MRVAYLINQYPKVSHTFIRREIQALERQGVEVERFALRGWDAEIIDAQDQAEQQKTRYTLKNGLSTLFFSVVRCLARRPGRFWRAFKLALLMSKNAIRPWPFHLIYLAHACRIMGWLEGMNVSHLHAHFGTNSAEIAALVHKLGGPEYSFTVHGSETYDDAKQNALNRKLTSAKFVAVVCAYIGSQLMRHVSPEYWPKIRTVHCGLSEDAFAESNTPLPTSPVFLSIGRLSEEKGHLVLLKAFASVLMVHPEARLVIAGDGHLRPQLEAKIKKFGIDSSVYITGWISSERVRSEIRNCHVLVQPSFAEGLPVVIMEAMAQRRPVISTYIAGIPELVIPGKTGWLVPAGNARALARAMSESAAVSSEILRALGGAGYARARKRHDVNIGASKLKTLFAAGMADESRG